MTPLESVMYVCVCVINTLLVLCACLGNKVD